MTTDFDLPSISENEKNKNKLSEPKNTQLVPEIEIFP